MGSNDQEDAGAGKKSEGQVLAEKLLVNKKNCWDDVSAAAEEEIEAFATAYKRFLDAGKTERELVAQGVELLERGGFKNIETFRDGAAAPGAGVYQNNRGKSLVIAVMGKRPLSEGINIVGAHADSPRIDLKTNPLYEEGEFALLDTHYYGGIKNYQWTAIPLALHGVIITGEGKSIPIRIGEDEGDPVFTITDLLPHLAKEQMQKKVSEFLSGEDLNVLAGSRPYQDEKVKERVKLYLLNILHERYGMVERDFAGAELELVPAHKARDLGFDRSMIGGYGHDDRCCAYAALRGVLSMAAGEAPEKTALCVLTDKEEIGSAGNTGAQSRFFEDFIAFLAEKTREPYSDLTLRRCFSRAAMLSADVNAAYDPNFDSVYDKKNASFLGKGLGLTKYTGSGGKFGGSDANAEYYRRVQGILDKNGVPWQYGDMGKVDKGGGGTIAKYMANLGIDVLDCGIPVLSMHSPFEVISKIDLHTTYRGYAAFFRDA
jgi:aspartyl aminopeptidase